MPAIANTIRKPKKASFARMLAHLAFGFGISTGAAMFTDSANGQSCDRCTGMSSPSCGCESPFGKHAGAKQCSCLRKPSLGEKLLSHLDRVGDQIESKARNSAKAPSCSCQSSHGPSCGVEPLLERTCGCEAPQSPNCGCEICSSSSTAFYSPQPPIQSANVRSPFVDPNRVAKGSLGDKPSNSPPLPTGKPNVEKKLDVSTSLNFNEPSYPPVQRVPFDQRKSSAPPMPNRIPVIELDPISPTNQPIPNVLKPVPSDPPPAWAPTTLPLKTKAVAPFDAKLPDVLVDPFKDDLSLNGNEGLWVIPSSYSEAKSAPVIVRKELSKGVSSEVPNVSKTRVPSKR